MLGSKLYKTLVSILSGVKAIHIVKKEQVDLRDQPAKNQSIFGNQLFELNA